MNEANEFAKYLSSLSCANHVSIWQFDAAPDVFRKLAYDDFKWKLIVHVPSALHCVGSKVVAALANGAPFTRAQNLGNGDLVYMVPE
jgi:hypothetical protein